MTDHVQRLAADTVALMLKTAAALERFPDTGRLAAEQALDATPSSDVSVTTSGASNPTEALALARHAGLPTQHPFEDERIRELRAENRLTGAEGRWLIATTALGYLVGQPLPKSLRAATAVVERNRNAYLIGLLDKYCREILAVIHLCHPLTRDEAQKILAEGDKLARATDCRACGVPIDKPENRKLGLYDQWCYKRIDRWKQAFPELGAIDDHHPEFCAWIRHHITNRTPDFDRPASIHSPIGKLMIHEDEAS